MFGEPTIYTGKGADGIWRTGDDTTSSTSAVDNPYMFTGRRLDAETGLYYYRARMYHPDIGRFLQPDPIGYSDSINLYQYCLNNPVNFVDPSGFLFERIKRARAVYKNTSEVEKNLIRKHPIAAREVYRARAAAINATMEKFKLKHPKDIKDDTILNAYLHAYFSAQVTRSLDDIVLAKQFLDAHEQTDVPQIDEYGSKIRMDLYNNMIGRALATAYYNKGKTVKQIIDEALDQGLLAASPFDEKLKTQRTKTGKGCPQAQ